MKVFVSIMLVLSTATLAVLSLVQLGRIDIIDDLTTDSVIEKGELLFEQDLSTTFKVNITAEDETKYQFIFDPETGLWNGTSPWQDRADGPKAIDKLVRFAMNAQIQDVLEATDEHEESLNLGEKAINIEFINSLDQTIADFKLGKSSAWKVKKEVKTDLKTEEVLIPTVYLRRNEETLDDNIYLCMDSSGEIHSLFADNYSAFRDHRPFALNIGTLKQARIVRDKTEIVISHDAPLHPWKITKPLELDTDRPAVMKFLANLSKIKAIALHETNSVTLPESTEGAMLLGISDFQNDEEVLLTVYPAADGAGSCYATVSNRDVVFELPLIATPNTSNYITQLPRSVNELRSRTMMKWDKASRADLKALVVTSKSSPATPVIISRAPNNRYQLLTIDNKKAPIDETIFGSLIQKLAQTPVKDFASDAATDLSPYGLDQPLVTLDFLFFNEEPQRISFGKVEQKEEDDVQDIYYANLKGSPIVWEVEGEFISEIPTRSWSWQPKLIWNLPVIDILEFSAQQVGKEKITVKYDYIEDSFEALEGSKNRTADLNPQRAKFFLNENHLIKAQRRLSPFDPIARKALENPAFQVTISVQGYDDEGLETQIENHTLTLAKPPGSSNAAFYYAQASNVDGYFTLNLETVRKLAALDFFEED